MAVTEDAAPRKRVARVRIASVEDGFVRMRRDRLVAEEPLEIRAAGPEQEPVSVAVTMRTPGNDMELAAGFLFTEGLIAGADAIETMRYCDLTEPEEQRYNIVTVNLRRPFDPGAFQRNFYATSSCGVCGKASIDQVELLAGAVSRGPEVEGAMLETLPEALRAAQDVFEETGGLHATGLFTAEGELLAIREDVGRHNAMDKLIGHELLAGRVPASDRVAVVSGRASFELVQKAAMAGIPILCAVSAPTTLAVDTAKRLSMTLVGFLRGGRYNIYAGPERIALG
jgi:FdhD protein